MEDALDDALDDDDALEDALEEDDALDDTLDDALEDDDALDDALEDALDDALEDALDDALNVFGIFVGGIICFLLSLFSRFSFFIQRPVLGLITLPSGHIPDALHFPVSGSLTCPFLHTITHLLVLGLIS